MKALLGRKLGMTQVFDEADRLIPVTVLEVGPCVVTQVKTEKNDGYRAMQVAFGDIKDSKVNSPMRGHFEKAGVEPRRHVAEVRLGEGEDYSVGDTLTVDIFEAGQKTKVSGVSKGKGFAGVMKRHGFKGGPGGHGSHFHRQPGSIGQCATPSRVFPGQKLAGQMGNKKSTTRNLRIVRVDAAENLLFLEGAVPGPSRGIVMVALEGGRQ